MEESARFSIKKKMVEGNTIYVLSSESTGECLELIPEAGFNIVRYRSHGVDIIEPSSELSDYKHKSSEYGNAALCPPNYLKGGTFRFGETTYQFPLNHESVHHLHGEIRSQSWEVITSNAEAGNASVTARLRLEDVPSIYSYYPHRLVFEFTYQLREGELIHSGIIRNEGAEAAPFGLGFHPYFSYKSGEKIRVQFNAEKEYPFSGESFIQGSPAKTAFCEQLSKGIRVEEVPVSPPGFQLYTLQGDRLQAAISRPNAGIVIKYEADKAFPFVALFKPSWMDAVSIEPYSCITDAFNSSLPEAERGLISLQPQASLQFENNIHISSMTE